MKHFLLTILIFVSFTSIAHAENATKKAAVEDNGDADLARAPLISRYYRAGSYLIYDCQDKHFACVDDLSFDKCKKWRKEAVEKMEGFMPCTPLKKFKNSKKCTKFHYEIMQRVVPKKFCLRVKKRD